MTTNLNILSLDDQASDAKLLQRHLERLMEVPISFTHSRTPEETLNELNNTEFDLFFVDYRLTGEQSGIDFLRFLRAYNYQVTTIMLTAHGGEYFAMDAARAGADGYLTKSDLNTESLGRSIAYAREKARERCEAVDEHNDIKTASKLSHELAALSIHLAQLSRLDSLTRVLNRESIIECIEMVHRQAKRRLSEYSVAIVHLDRDKQRKENAEEYRNNERLIHIAQILGGSTRSDDFVGRFDDNEFLIIFPDTELDEATEICRTINSDIHSPGMRNGVALDKKSLSIGVAGGSDEDWNLAIDLARRALATADSSVAAAPVQSTTSC